MKSYVISLKNNNEKRRNHIRHEFNKNSIDFSFFDAVTTEENDLIARKLNFNIQNTTLSQTELACLLSHASLWQKTIDLDLDYACIFEDDVYLSPNIGTFFKNVLEWIPKDAFVVNIEMPGQARISCYSKPIIVKNRKLYQLNGKKLNTGAAGYILSKKGAIYLLNHFRQLNTMVHIDIALFYSFLEDKNYIVYQMNPVLCIQDNILYKNYDNFYKTVLLPEKYTQSIKKSFIFKIKREISRPFKQLYTKLTTVKIYFR